ncbi:MAG: hypothetical protein ACFFC0_08240 [Promethearchaeota archaeon]
MEIPILSNMVEGLRVFFKTRRYISYLIIFLFTIFLSFMFSGLMSTYVGAPLELTLVTFFVYIGATGTIYFALGALIMGVGADSLWITRRGRGRVTELKGVVWLAISFALTVVLSYMFGREALLFFSIFCWIGWIAFQAYLSSRTSLRLATLAEPKKGGIAIGIGSFIVLIFGVGILGAEILAVLWLIPQDFMGIGTLITSIFPLAVSNLAAHGTLLWVAAGLLGLFALVSLLAFFRYAARGAALNIALMTVFIAIYSGYFMVNVMRRSGAPTMTIVDIAMSFFFLAYALSGIGTTLTEGVEESRIATRDFGPLLTFFLASGFFFVDSVIAVTSSPGSILSDWFNWAATPEQIYQNFLFRDIAKLLAFPLVATFTSLYYVLFERRERVADRIRKEEKPVERDEVDKDIAEELEEPSKETYPGAAPPDPGRLRIDDSRRLGKPKRFGEEDEE